MGLLGLDCDFWIYCFWDVGLLDRYIGLSWLSFWLLIVILIELLEISFKLIPYKFDLSLASSWHSNLIVVFWACLIKDLRPIFILLRL